MWLADFTRLMFYPMIVFGFLLLAASDRRRLLYSTLLLHFAVVGFALMLRLNESPVLPALVAWGVTPSVLLLTAAVYWTLWRERRKV